MNTDRPDQEETTDIDNQDPLKAWILFLTEKQIMQGKNNKAKTIWDRTVSKQDSDRIPENPLRMCDSDREEEDCLWGSLNSYTLLLPLQLAFKRGL
jgi:hypothetical protein